MRLGFDLDGTVADLQSALAREARRLFPEVDQASLPSSAAGTGDPKSTGKPAAADLSRRKVTLPIIRALRDSGQRQTLADLYRKETITDADVQCMLAILDGTTIQSDMITLVSRMAQATREVLGGIALPPRSAASRARDQLLSAVASLLPLAE